jgi:hypothetical protein
MSKRLRKTVWSTATISFNEDIEPVRSPIANVRHQTYRSTESGSLGTSITYVPAKVSPKKRRLYDEEIELDFSAPPAGYSIDDLYDCDPAYVSHVRETSNLPSTRHRTAGVNFFHSTFVHILNFYRTTFLI